MARVNTVTGDMHVQGSFTAQTNTPSDGAVTNAKVSASAAIATTKVQHLHKVGTSFGIEHDAAPSTSTTYTFPVFRASGVCTVKRVAACLLDTGSQANTNDFEFDLLKAAQGSDTPASILSAAFDVDSDIADNTEVDGTISNATLAEGDLLILSMVAPGTITGANGPFAWVEVEEADNN